MIQPPSISPRRKLRFIALLLLLPIVAAIGARWATLATAAPQAQFAPLTVVTKPIEPFVFTSGDEPQGFSIDLWKAVAFEAGLDYRFTVVDTVSESLDAVRNGDADAAIAAITITEDREQTLDFSLPYYRSGLGILTTPQTSPSPLDAALAALTPNLLRLVLLLLAVIIVAGHVIWLIERGRNDDFPTDYVHGVWQGIWWAAVTVTTVGYGDKTPKMVLGRLFGLLWMFAGLFIIANFTAAVTATLTAERLTTSISGPQDLPGHTIATVAGSTSDEWLTSQGIIHRTTELIDEAYAMLESGEVQAVVYDYPVIQYYALTSGNENLIVVGGPFNSEFYGIALQQGSLYTERIDLALLRVIESGTYDTIHARWFGSSGGL